MVNKLGSLIISGAEVYSVPQAPLAFPAEEAPPARTGGRRDAATALRALLRRTAAIGAQPVLPRGYGR